MLARSSHLANGMPHGRKTRENLAPRRVPGFVETSPLNFFRRRIYI